jgi:ketosteroid isomerase-like protein
VDPKDNLSTEGPPDGGGELRENPAVDEFLSQLNSQVAHAKPGQEAVTVVIEALQRLALASDTEEAVESAATDRPAGRECPACGGHNRPNHRFCSTCGASLPDESGHRETNRAALESPNPSSPPMPPGDHHYHHHYHHHFFSNSEGSGDSFNAGESRISVPNSAARDAARMRVSLSGTAMSRAEAAARQATQHWALACNTRQLDDIVDLYLPDALILRPNVPPVRGTASIREFFFTLLDSGFGDVELESLRVEMVGEMAYEAGRCKALVPSVAGKRREERGKYLMILTRQAGGEWKIACDCWSSDLSLGADAEAGKSSAGNAPFKPR